MEITTMQMYWLVMLDSINIGSAIMCVIIGFCILGLICISLDSYECPWFVKICAPFLVVLFSLLFAVCVFLPSTRQMAAIMIVPKIANSEKVQTIGNKVYDLAVEWMDALKPTKESEVTK